MDRISDKCKSMAAMAVFRDLYNQKKDIYSAIAEFVKLAIVENGLITFDLQEISNIIKENNGIELPLAVIKRSLNRLNFLHKATLCHTLFLFIDYKFHSYSTDAILTARNEQRHTVASIN